MFAGGAAWRKRLNDEIGDQGDVSQLIEKRSDDELAALMNNLGGHDLPSLLEAFHNAGHERPTCFIAYTIKGFGLPMAGHKDNHAGLMTPAQMETFRRAMSVRPGREWDRFEGLSLPPERLEEFLDRVPFAAGGTRRLSAPEIEVPTELASAFQSVTSTQTGFGALLNNIGRADSDFARRIVTTSPDVTVSTNLGSWVNRRGLFARLAMADTVQERTHPFDVQLGVLAPGSAYRTWHRRDESLYSALRAWPVALDQWRTIAASRHALRSVHRTRSRCA